MKLVNVFLPQTGALGFPQREWKLLLSHAGWTSFQTQEPWWERDDDEKPLLLLSLHGEIACRFINAQYKIVVHWQWLSGCQPVLLKTSWIYIALFHSKRSHRCHYSFTLVALSYMCRLTEASWLPQNISSHWQRGFECTWRQRLGWRGVRTVNPLGYWIMAERAKLHRHLIRIRIKKNMNMKMFFQLHVSPLDEAQKELRLTGG